MDLGRIKKLAESLLRNDLDAALREQTITLGQLRRAVASKLGMKEDAGQAPVVVDPMGQIDGWVDPEIEAMQKMIHGALDASFEERNRAKEGSRSTVSANDILTSLSDLEFDEFLVQYRYKKNSKMRNRERQGAAAALGRIWCHHRPTDSRIWWYGSSMAPQCALAARCSAPSRRACASQPASCS